MNNRYMYKLCCPASLILMALLTFFVVAPESIIHAASSTQFPTSGTVLRNARLRAGPSTTYAAIGSLRGGTTIQFSSCNSSCNWYQLSNGGWVAGFLIQLNGTSPAMPASSANASRPTSIPPLYQAVIQRNANLRSRPSVNSLVVGTVERGRTVNISSQSADGRWLQLDNGVWIAASLIQRGSGASVAPAPAPAPLAPAPTTAADLPKPANTVPNTAPNTGGSTGSNTAPCACDRDRYNCNSFGSLALARQCANYCASQNLGDIHNMDLNQNGLVCENVTWSNIPAATARPPAATRVPTRKPTRTPALVPTINPTPEAATMPTLQQRERETSFGEPVSSNASASASVLSCSCSTDTYDCSDFISQASAQSCFWYCGSVGAGDIHKLDMDNNQVVCDDSDLSQGMPMRPTPTVTRWPVPPPRPPAGLLGDLDQEPRGSGGPNMMVPGLSLQQ